MVVIFFVCLLPVRLFSLACDRPGHVTDHPPRTYWLFKYLFYHRGNKDWKLSTFLMATIVSIYFNHTLPEGVFRKVSTLSF